VLRRLHAVSSAEMKKHGLMHVYLNATPAMTGLPAEELIRQCPGPLGRCLQERAREVRGRCASRFQSR